MIDLKLLRHYAWILLGAACLLAGLATIWLPLPTGIVLILAGLALLVRESHNFRDWLTRIRGDHPGISARIRQAGQRLPARVRGFIDATDPASAQAPEASDDRADP